MGRNYTKIKAWELSDQLALNVYKVTGKFPKSEMWNLTSQMRRAAISVPANIVEGSSRKNQKEYLQFLYISFSSLKELEYYIRFVKEMRYISDGEHNKIWQECQETVKTLKGLIAYIEDNK